MSDCANGGRNTYERPEGYPTLRLRVEFDSGNPWTYPIALNGREVTGLYVDGRRYVREPEGAAVNGVLVLRHLDVDESAVIGVTLNGRRYVPAPEPDWDAECEVD